MLFFWCLEFTDRHAGLEPGAYIVRTVFVMEIDGAAWLLGA